MSERGDALRGALCEKLDTTHGQGRRIARAICEHLGVTWADVDVLDAFLKSGLVWEANPKSGPAPYLKVRDALATLFEAAGIPQDGDAP